MKETLILAIQELQLEKSGKATLDDVTQEWIEKAITDYKCEVTEDASIAGKRVMMQKDEEIGKFIIDENLNVTEIITQGDIEFSYDIGERTGTIVNILIHIQDKVNGLSRIELPDADAIIVESNKKEEKAIDYQVEIGTEYKFKITSKNGETREETILIDSYWYKITKNLDEGISIDNTVTKAEYNKPYQATITTEGNYELETFIVTMGGQEVLVDVTTGIINIEKVTGDIEITIKGEKVEIVWTNDTTANRTIDGNSAIYKNPIIPVGFSAINTEDAKWDKENGASSEWNNGLVIKNATDGNEFVWIPVDGTDVPYAKWCTLGYSYEECKDVASTSGLDIKDNVTDYGGFWVARYEAGLATILQQLLANKDGRNKTGKPLSIAGAIPWNCIDLNNSKVNAESMYSNDYVQSGLLNGTQWDTIMKWVNNGGYDVTTGSGSWGNHNDTVVVLRGGKYGYVSTDNGASWTSATQKINSYNQLIKTGASNDTKAKNIYDLSGNLAEWVCEVQKYNQPLYRGGRFNSNVSNDAACNRTCGGTSEFTFNGLGFRVQLYIK